MNDVRASGEQVMGLTQWNYFCMDFNFFRSLRDATHELEAERIIEEFYEKCSTTYHNGCYQLSFINFLYCVYLIWRKLFELYEDDDLFEVELRPYERRSSFLAMRPDEQAFIAFFQTIFSETVLKQCKERIRQRRGEKVEKKIDRVTYAVPKRSSRFFDIYNGPKLIATMQDTGGYIVPKRVESKLSEWLICSFARLQSYDDTSDTVLLSHLSYCEGFVMYVERILDQGFDIAAATNPSTRNLLGRSWRMLQKGKVVGSLLDYPGQFSCLQWVPIAGELESSDFTMTMYVKENVPVFDTCFNCFMKCKAVSSLITALEREDISVVPMLYL
jgi:hypothetical protein